MVEAEEWKTKALCADRLDLDFVSDSTEDTPPSPQTTISNTRACRRLCAKCPVVEECLIYAMDSPHSTRYGIYGGTTGKQRQAALRNYPEDPIGFLMQWFEGWQFRDSTYRSRKRRPAPSDVAES